MMDGCLKNWRLTCNSTATKYSILVLKKVLESSLVR